MGLRVRRHKLWFAALEWHYMMQPRLAGTSEAPKTDNRQNGRQTTKRWTLTVGKGLDAKLSVKPKQ